MGKIFEEVRSDYYDSYDNEWCIDAWWPNNEEGVVAVRINPDTLEVKYTREEFKEDEEVVQAVREKIRDILNGKA